MDGCVCGDVGFSCGCRRIKKGAAACLISSSVNDQNTSRALFLLFFFDSKSTAKKVRSVFFLRFFFLITKLRTTTTKKKALKRVCRKHEKESSIICNHVSALLDGLCEARLANLQEAALRSWRHLVHRKPAAYAHVVREVYTVRGNLLGSLLFSIAFSRSLHFRSACLFLSFFFSAPLFILSRSKRPFSSTAESQRCCVAYDGGQNTQGGRSEAEWRGRGGKPSAHGAHVEPSAHAWVLSDAFNLD